MNIRPPTEKYSTKVFPTEATPQIQKFPLISHPYQIGLISILQVPLLASGFIPYLKPEKIL